MERIITYLKNLHPISQAFEAQVRKSCRFTNKKKNEFLLVEGEVCRYAWYLQKGLVRCFYNRYDREVTTWFMEQDNPVVLYKSLFDQKKSLFNLQALEDCSLYSIHYHDIQALYQMFPEIIYIHKLVTEHYSHLQTLKIRATSSLSARDRYRYFEKHFPHLLIRIKLEYIASYLDMDVRTLTRARKYK